MRDDRLAVEAVGAVSVLSAGHSGGTHITDEQIAAAKAHHAAIMTRVEEVVALARAADPEESNCFISINVALADLNEHICEAPGIEVTYLP